MDSDSELDDELDESELERILLAELAEIQVEEESEDDEESKCSEAGEEEVPVVPSPEDEYLAEAWKQLEIHSKNQEASIAQFEQDFGDLKHTAAQSTACSEEGEKAIARMEAITAVLYNIVAQIESTEGERMRLEALEADRINRLKQEKLTNENGTDNEIPQKRVEGSPVSARSQIEAKCPDAVGEQKPQRMKPRDVFKGCVEINVNEEQEEIEERDLKTEGNAFVEETKMEREPINGLNDEEKQEHDKFLEELNAEMEKREQERLETLREIEAEKAEMLRKAQLEWRRQDCAKVIQRTTRIFLNKRSEKRKKSAATMIQSAMRHLTNRIRGLKLRRKMKTIVEMEKNQHDMVIEDKLAQDVRRFYTRNLEMMQKEDQLCLQLRELEKKQAHRERQDMQLEDLFVQKLRALERQKEQIESSIMGREDTAGARLRKEGSAFTKEMQKCDDENARFRYELSEMLCSRVHGDTIDLRDGGFVSFSDAKNVGLLRPKKILGARNQFLFLDDVGPLACLGSVRHLSLEENKMLSLRGVQGCRELMHINLSRNELLATSLKALGALEKVEYLDLSYNPIGPYFDAKSTLGASLESIREIRLSHCKLQSHPQSLVAPRLHSLFLDSNEISGHVLVDRTSSLQSLVTLDISSNILKSLRLRCAHDIPKLQVLDVSNNEFGEESNLSDGLIEHINLRSLRIAPLSLTKQTIKSLRRYLRKLTEMDGDGFYLYRAFSAEIIQLQSSIRGALKREQIRVALEKAKFMDPEDDESFEPINLDEFDAEISDEEDEPKQYTVQWPSHQEPISLDLSSKVENLDGKTNPGENYDRDGNEQYAQAVARLKRITQLAYEQVEHRPEQEIDAESMQQIQKGTFTLPVLSQTDTSHFPQRPSGNSPVPVPTIRLPGVSNQVTGPSPPISREESSSRLSHRNTELDSFREEWGFKEEKTAKSLLQRRNKNLKAQKDKLRKEKLNDPVQRYEELMKRVKGKDPSSSTHSDGKKMSSSHPASQALRDRQQHMLKRSKVPLHVPAWAKGPGQDS